MAPPVPLDRRVQHLIDGSRSRGHRCLFLVLQDHSIAVQLLYLALRPWSTPRPTVLWCHRRQPSPAGLRHPRRLIHALQRLARRPLSADSAETRLDLLQAAAEIHLCHLGRAASLMGRTFHSAVLQDLQALTPNALAQAVETVAAGGVVLLLAPPEMTSLDQLAAAELDAHARFRTPGHPRVRPLFMRRLIDSLGACDAALAVDGRGRILPLTDRRVDPPPSVGPPPDGRKELRKAVARAKVELEGREVAVLVDQCQTEDQARVVVKLVETFALSERENCVAAVTAPRGRGKSAALGLCVAAALHCGRSSVWVAAPSAEAAGTLFHFAQVGLRLLGHSPGADGGKTRRPDEEPAAVTAVWLRARGGRRQAWARLLLPAAEGEGAGGARFPALAACDLLCVDEAAAIPLPLVRALLDAAACPALLASTVNGYEGTGRSLSLKLVSELRGAKGWRLSELSLREAIRYRPGDPVERWLEALLCLDCADDSDDEPPAPEECQLLEVSRRALFSGHALAERLLRRLTALSAASHYRNSPNDLLLLADSPSQRLFALAAPPARRGALPALAAVLQVALEGGLPVADARRGLGGSGRPAGDLLAWTLAQQFRRPQLASLRAARVVRVAVRPRLQGRGFGSAALRLLHAAAAAPGGGGPGPALMAAARWGQPVDYLGVACGLTAPLLRFWRRLGYLPAYLRHTRSDATGEHSCVLVRAGATGRRLFRNFRDDFVRASPLAFPHLPMSLALSLIRRGKKEEEDTEEEEEVDASAIAGRFSAHDMAQLRAFCRGQCDFHMLLKLVPAFCELYFTHKLRPRPGLTLQEEYILFCIGGQGVSRVESVAETLSSALNRFVAPSQVLGLFKRMLTRFLSSLEEMPTLAQKRRMSDDEEDAPCPQKRRKEDT